jgi:Fe-S-cluster-containing dehydrogenase component
VQYGFVINQETCIGCHACTVACKAENEVPVGGFRTNVKYVESGAFPQVKRSFLVQRCNHCTNAPCVTICPVNALTKRPDGIVDVDRDACIGCRACMQACPYDALYLNEDLGAVEKCHFCAHRIERGLQPACVTVCPVGAIVPGDLHDPSSEVSLLRRAHELSTRRPEQKTGPNVFYIGASDVALNPGRAERPRQYLWSDRRPTKPEDWPLDTPRHEREVLNADAKVEWGWPVALYLLTKGIAAGAAMIAPFFGVFDQPVAWWLPESVALFFTLATVALLIEDLKKPLHFYKLFTRPNWDSWLVKGGIVLTAFGALSALILAIGLLGPDGPTALVEPLRWANALLGVFVAGYTAFLFKQCKGRDLWEAPGLFWHLLAQSATAGAATYLFAGEANGVAIAAFLLGATVTVTVLVTERRHAPSTDNEAQARAFLRSKGVAVRLAAAFVVCAGLVTIASTVPIYDFPAAIPRALTAVASGVAILFMFEYERAYVRAGQLPPLS